jgi:hypothetical protein
MTHAFLSFSLYLLPSLSVSVSTSLFIHRRLQVLQQHSNNTAHENRTESNQTFTRPFHSSFIYSLSLCFSTKEEEEEQEE